MARSGERASIAPARNADGRNLPCTADAMRSLTLLALDSGGSSPISSGLIMSFLLWFRSFGSELMGLERDPSVTVAPCPRRSPEPVSCDRGLASPFPPVLLRELIREAPAGRPWRRIGIA